MRPDPSAARGCAPPRRTGAEDFDTSFRQFLHEPPELLRVPGDERVRGRLPAGEAAHVAGKHDPRRGDRLTREEESRRPSLATGASPRRVPGAATSGYPR